MRLLIYGMMSSGATSFSLFCAQRPDALALVDVLNNFAAPQVATPKDMLCKVTITTAYALSEHMERFRPDKIVLFLRDPRDNYESLKTKNYRNYSGLMEEKFLLLDEVFAKRNQFDAVIHYEDFVARDPAVLRCVNALGWPVCEDYYQYSRRHNEIFRDLWDAMPDLYARLELNFGNVQGAGVSRSFRDKYRSAEQDEALAALLEPLCPRLLAHYQQRALAAAGVEPAAISC